MRKVYIIPEGYDSAKAETEAEALGIGEIARGVPPRIAREIGENHKLPYVYEEAEQPVVKDKLTELEERIIALEEKLNISPVER